VAVTLNRPASRLGASALDGSNDQPHHYQPEQNCEYANKWVLTHHGARKNECQDRTNE
jgi:hypothetical protein